MLQYILSFFALTVTLTQSTSTNYSTALMIPNNNCIQFKVTQGTGCAWMCNYCSNTLGTYNYYFPDNVCTYQQGGCVGNPIAGKLYTCCSV